MINIERSLYGLRFGLFLIRDCFTHKLAEKLIHKFVLILDFLQHFLLFHLMLARAFTLQTGVYLLRLLKKLREEFGQFGDAVERFGNFVDHPYILVSILLSTQVLIDPYPKVSLTLVFLQVGSISRVCFQTFLHCLNDVVQKTTEPVAELTVNRLKPHQFLQLLWKITPIEGVENCL
jgi:hypothetical protein